MSNSPFGSPGGTPPNPFPGGGFNPTGTPQPFGAPGENPAAFGATSSPFPASAGVPASFGSPSAPFPATPANSFDSNSGFAASAFGISAPGIAPASGGTAKATHAPLVVLYLALLVFLTGAALSFFLSRSLFLALIPWAVCTLGFVLVGIFLALDGKARGAVRYVIGTADAILFKLTIIIGLLCVIIASAQFGLIFGRM